MKTAENIKAGQLVIETRARFTDPISGLKMRRAGVIEETSKTKACLFFYIGPREPLEVPLSTMTKMWKEWDGTVTT